MSAGIFVNFEFDQGMNNPDPNDFERAATEQRGGNTIHEIWLLLKHNKKWWLLPIIALLMIFAVLIFLSGTAVAPFIYTLF